MPVIVQDRFEGHTIGQAPGGAWTVAAGSGGGAVTVEADPAAGGTRGKVLKLLEGTGGGATSTHSEAKLTLAGSAGRDKLVVVFEVYAGQSSKKLYVGVVANGTRYDLFALWNDVSVRYRSGAPSTFSALTTPTNYTAFAWQRFRLVIDRSATGGELVKVSLNDVDKNTTALNVPNITDPIDAVVFATDDTEDGATFYLNDVVVLEKTSRIRGVSRDHNRAILSGVRVVLIRHSTEAVDASQLTDAYGRYAFDVDAGVYYLLSAYHPSLANYGGPVAPWLFAE